MLHDAFFKYQTKPKLTSVGEMYYEGKEFEAAITHARPGGWVMGGRAGQAVGGPRRQSKVAADWGVMLH